MNQPSNNQQNTGTYEPANRMSQPPPVITTKDLAYLKDAMSWELLATKKCRMYAAFANDPAIRNQLDQTGQLHQNHYEQLLQLVMANPNQHYPQ
jgi:hypothetical protein